VEAATGRSAIEVRRLCKVFGAKEAVAVADPPRLLTKYIISYIILAMWRCVLTA